MSGVGSRPFDQAEGLCNRLLANESPTPICKDMPFVLCFCTSDCASEMYKSDRLVCAAATRTGDAGYGNGDVST